MTSDLFREEVLRARRTSWLGAIHLAQPLGHRFLTIAVVIVASAVVLFLACGTYTRRSTVSGRLVSTQGLATVLAPSTGVLTRLQVFEGSQVKQGEAIGVVHVPSSTIANGDTLAALEQHFLQRRSGLEQAFRAETRQRRVQQQSAISQLAEAERELVQIELEAQTKQQQIQIANETLQRLLRLEDSQYVSILQIKQQEATGLEYKGQLHELQRQAIAARRTLAQLRQASLEAPDQQDVAAANLARQIAELDQERVQVQATTDLVITAPVAGIVATQIVKPGQAVQQNQPLLSVLPKTDHIEAELLIPSRAIGFMTNGDRVLLRYQAFPYQKFGHQPGTVSRISRSALTPSELEALSGMPQQSEPYYRITVALANQTVSAYGKSETLRPGMLVDADVLGESRSLLEWILEPLRSVTGNLRADRK